MNGDPSSFPVLHHRDTQARASRVGVFGGSRHGISVGPSTPEEPPIPEERTPNVVLKEAAKTIYVKGKASRITVHLVVNKDTKRQIIQVQSNHVQMHNPVHSAKQLAEELLEYANEGANKGQLDLRKAELFAENTKSEERSSQ